MHFRQTPEMIKFYHRDKIVLEWVINVLTVTLQITISVSVDN